MMLSRTRRLSSVWALMALCALMCGAECGSEVEWSWSSWVSMVLVEPKTRLREEVCDSLIASQYLSR